MLTSFYEVIRLLGGQFLLTYHIFVHSKNDFILRDFFTAATYQNTIKWPQPLLIDKCFLIEISWIFNAYSKNI